MGPPMLYAKFEWSVIIVNRQHSIMIYHIFWKDADKNFELRSVKITPIHNPNYCCEILSLFTPWKAFFIDLSLPDMQMKGLIHTNMIFSWPMSVIYFYVGIWIWA